LLPVAARQQHHRHGVQSDDADAVRVLATAACAAPRIVEQSGPASRERSRHLFLVHDGLGIPPAWTRATVALSLLATPRRVASDPAAGGVSAAVSYSVRCGEGLE